MIDTNVFSKLSRCRLIIKTSTSSPTSRKKPAPQDKHQMPKHWVFEQHLLSYSHRLLNLSIVKKKDKNRTEGRVYLTLSFPGTAIAAVKQVFHVWPLVAKASESKPFTKYDFKRCQDDITDHLHVKITGRMRPSSLDADTIFYCVRAITTPIKFMKQKSRELANGLLFSKITKL